MFNDFLPTINANVKKMDEKIWLTYYGNWSRIVCVRFLGELKTPKRHFEVNWPLVIAVPGT